MNEKEKENKYRDWFYKQPKYRLGSKCLVTKWVKISDPSAIEILEKMPDVEVFDGKARWFHVFK